MPVQFNQLLEWKFEFFNGNSWAQLFSGLIQFFARLFYYLIIGAIGKIADVCQLVMRKFAGISDGIKMEGQEVQGDLVYWIFQTSIVKNLLISLALLAVFILIIATFVGTIKTEFAKDGNNNKRKVVKNAFRGLANFVLVPVICMFGIFVGNALLKAIDGATSPGSGQSLSAQMFVVGGYNANRARKSQNENYDGTNRPYKEKSFGAYLVGLGDGQQSPEKGSGNFGIFVDDNASSVAGKRAADKIDLYFANNGVIKINDQNNSSAFLHYEILDNWNGGALTGDVKLDVTNTGTGATSSIDVGKMVLINPGQEIKFSIYNMGLVYYYYDLSFGSFDYLTSAIALIFCAYTLLVTVLGLIKRLFMLVTLFVISAPVCAIYPIDDGKSLEKWRTAFIKEALSAYSVVVVMNLFLSLIPLFNQLTLFTGNGDLLFLSGIPFIVDFANYMARVLIVIGALTFFKKATQQISDIIGAGNSYGEGAEAAGAFAKNVGRVAVGGRAFAHGVGAAAKLPWNMAKSFNQHMLERNKRKENEKDEKFKADLLAKGDAMGPDGKATDTSGDIGDGASLNQQTGGAGSGGSGSTAAQGAPAPNIDDSNLVKDKDGNVDWRASRKRAEGMNYFEKKSEAAKKSLLKKRAKLQKKADSAFETGDRIKWAKTLEKEYDAEKKYQKAIERAGKKDVEMRKVKPSIWERNANISKKIKNWAVVKAVREKVDDIKGITGSIFKPFGNFASGFIDTVKGLTKGDFKMKDAREWSKGSRAKDEKKKKIEEKQSTKVMQNNIAQISSKMDKILEQQKRSDEKIDSVDKRVRDGQKKKK